MEAKTKRMHTYATVVRWTGNTGAGTSGYRAYTRDHEISAAGKPTLPGSSDRAFRGDPARYSPEDLLVASLSSCHMLWFLHLCADSGVVVTGYVDEATGLMVETDDGGGHFTEVTLRPRVTISKGDPSITPKLHDRAHDLCFIASSVNFPVRCEPTVELRA